MQDSQPPAQPHHSVRLILNHAVSAMVLGLCTTLPATGATFLLALGASCLSSRGCDAPTVIDALVPIVAITVWTTTTLIVGSRQIRTVLSASHTATATPITHLPPHITPRGSRP